MIYMLGQYSQDFEEHSMMFLLGDVKHARWAKLKGDSDPGIVGVKVQEVLMYRESGGDPLKLPAPR